MFDLVGGSLLCFTSNTENQINERTEKNERFLVHKFNQFESEVYCVVQQKQNK